MSVEGNWTHSKYVKEINFFFHSVCQSITSLSPILKCGRHSVSVIKFEKIFSDILTT